jgi:hypothetical protein
MEDASTGQLIRQSSPAGPAETEPGDTDADAASPAGPAEAEPGDTDPDISRPAPEDWRSGGRRTGGRRYRAGRPSPERRRANEQPTERAAPFPTGFEGLGTLGGLFGCCLASCLLAAWLHLTVVAGLGFCAGSAVAAWYCQSAALLRLVVAVPAVFAAAEILAQLATLPSGSRRGLALPVAGGTLLTLATVAPWLFGGTAGAVVIALFRGLPRCVRDLRVGIHGSPQARRAPRGPHAQQALRAQQALLAQLPPRAQRVSRAHQAQQARQPRRGRRREAERKV